MKKKILLALMSFIFLGAGNFLLPAQALSHDVDVHIGIGIGVPPPAVVVPAPPAVFLIPGSYVYFAPDVGLQLFFYSGYWYSLHNGYWFRSTYYNGPWYYLPPARVPVAFLHLPPDYYRIPHGQRLIPYGHLKKHWKEWDRKHYKEQKDWEKNLHKQWKEQDEGWKKWKSEKPGKGNHKR